MLLEDHVVICPVYGNRKVLLDGLLVCDATPCHGLVARLASEQGQLTPGQVNMWLAGLHLHTSAHPSLVTQLLVRPLSREFKILFCPVTTRVNSHHDVPFSVLPFFLI